MVIVHSITFIMFLQYKIQFMQNKKIRHYQLVKRNASTYVF